MHIAAIRYTGVTNPKNVCNPYTTKDAGVFWCFVASYQNAGVSIN